MIYTCSAAPKEVALLVYTAFSSAKKIFFEKLLALQKQFLHL